MKKLSDEYDTFADMTTAELPEKSIVDVSTEAFYYGAIATMSILNDTIQQNGDKLTIHTRAQIQSITSEIREYVNSPKAKDGKL